MAGRARMILPRPDLCHLISENTPELWTLPVAFVCHGGSLGKIQIYISLIFLLHFKGSPSPQMWMFFEKSPNGLDSSLSHFGNYIALFF